MTVAAVVQARMGAARLPGKALALVDGPRTLLECVLDRLGEARCRLDETVVATTTGGADDAIERHCRARGVRVVRGDEDNVLRRFLQAADECRAEAVVRVCADNPLLDPGLLAETVELFLARRPDYAAHATPDGVPSICTPAGLFVECVAVGALRRLDASGPEPAVAGHVTLGIYSGGGYDCAWLPAPPWAMPPWLRLTCDTPGDLERLRTIFAQGPVRGPRRALVDWLASRPDMAEAMRAENRRHPKPAVVVAQAKPHVHAGQAFQPVQIVGPGGPDYRGRQAGKTDPRE